MNETDALLAAWSACRRRERPAVLATVVKVTGSAYRRPGARMIFPEGAAPAGVVSGGCLEGDLAERAREVLLSGEPRVQVYDMRSPDDIVWGLGLGCNGEIRVLLERLSPAPADGDLADFLAACRGRREPGVAVTFFGVEGVDRPRVGEHWLLYRDGRWSGESEAGDLAGNVREDAKAVLQGGRSRVGLYEQDGVRVEALIEYVAPPVCLHIFGAGSDARPLVDLAAGVGWEVGVYDNRASYADPAHFPAADRVQVVEFEKLSELGLRFDARTPVVVMTHHFLHDLEILKFLVSRPLPYLGLLGPRQRTENLLRELGASGVRIEPDRVRTLYGPVGLDIGAETPEEIALSVLAEIQAALARRDGGFLRDRKGPLHDWA